MFRKVLLAGVAGIVVLAAGAATAEAGRCYRGGYGGGGYYYGGYGPRVTHYYGGPRAYYRAPYRHSYYRGGYGYGFGPAYGYGYPRSGVSFSIGF